MTGSKFLPLKATLTWKQIPVYGKEIGKQFLSTNGIFAVSSNEQNCKYSNWKMKPNNLLYTWGSQTVANELWSSLNIYSNNKTSACLQTACSMSGPVEDCGLSRGSCSPGERPQGCVREWHVQSPGAEYREARRLIKGPAVGVNTQR